MPSFYVTSYLIAMVMFEGNSNRSFTILKIFTIVICMTLTLTFFESKFNVNMPIESSYITSNLTAVLVCPSCQSKYACLCPTI